MSDPRDYEAEAWGWDSCIEHEAIGPAQERRNRRKVRGVVYSDSPPSDESREIVRQWAAQKIERLEAELAKEKAEHKDLLRMIEKDQYDLIEKVWRMEAELADLREWADACHAKEQKAIDELADLRASSVVVRERCASCDGSGKRVWLKHGDKASGPCPDCDNGWQLAEGVEGLSHDPEWGWYDSDTPTHYVIPARLIERVE